MQSPRWHADQNVMRLQLARMTAEVERLQPARGVQQLCIEGRPVNDVRLLQVDLPAMDPANPAAIDAFLRGDDLAITYADRPAPDMRAQVYWRAADGRMPGVVATIELMVSVQTSLLDTRPGLSTRSVLSAHSAYQWTDGAGSFTEISTEGLHVESIEGTDRPRGYLFRLAGSEFSYAEMVHPAGARLTRVVAQSAAASPRAEISHELFPDRLEKGVILRARVLGVFLERSGDESTAAKHFADFLKADLPLTA